MELDLEEMMVNMTDTELHEMEAMFMDHGESLCIGASVEYK